MIMESVDNYVKAHKYLIKNLNVTAVLLYVHKTGSCCLKVDRNSSYKINITCRLVFQSAGFLKTLIFFFAQLPKMATNDGCIQTQDNIIPSSKNTKHIFFKTSILP